MYTAKGSDVRPGVPPVSLGFRRFCVAGVGPCALPRGRMYALAPLRYPSGIPPVSPPGFLRCSLVFAVFPWVGGAWDNLHCQGVGCTPWRPSGIPPVSLGFRHFCVAGVGQCALPRGRMYALASLRCPSGVPPVSLGFCPFCVPGMEQRTLPRGRMYALASLRYPSGVPWFPPLLRGRRGPVCTPKGSDVRPGVPPVSLGFRRFCVVGVGQCALPRGRMYALASLRCPSGVPPVSLGFCPFCVPGMEQRTLPRGRMYALASLRYPSGVPWFPPLLRGRRGPVCTPKGSDVRPGVPPVSLGFRCFCVVGVGQCTLPRGRMYALSSLRCPLVSAAFAWQACDNVHCQGVGCMPWRPSGVPPVCLRYPSGVRPSPPLLRGRCRTTYSAKGSGVRPGVPPVSLGLHHTIVLLRSQSLVRSTAEKHNTSARMHNASALGAKVLGYEVAGLRLF